MERTLYSVRNQSNQTGFTHSRGWMVLFSSFILFFAFNSLSQDAVSNEANPALMKNRNKEHEVILLAKTIWNKYVELKEIEESDKAHSYDFESRIQPFMEKFKQSCPSYPAQTFMIMDQDALVIWVRENHEEALNLEKLFLQILDNN